MKGFLNYLTVNIKKGNYTTGILIGITLLIYCLILIRGIVTRNIVVAESSIIWLLIGGMICISWSHYWYDKNKK